MPHNKIKKIFTVLISVLFALSIGYFAVLPQTSAWFYQNLQDETEEFVFGTLEVNQTFIVPASLDIPAATKLENEAVFGETLFDEALQIETITAENIGTLPARVYLTITANSGSLSGLRYFFCDADDAGSTFKDKIANKITITANAANTYTALDTYNIGDGVPGGDEGRYIVVQPEEAKIIKIAFWADYDVVGDDLVDTNNVMVHYAYNVKITLNAVQDSDGAFTR